MVNAANSGTQMPITTGQICAFGKFMFAWVWLAFIYHLHILKFRTQSGVTGFAYHAEKSKCLFSIKAAPNYITVKKKKNKDSKRNLCVHLHVCVVGYLGIIRALQHTLETDTPMCIYGF